MAKDYYELLGLTKSATADDIKRAYRKLALQYHPDRNKDKDAVERFKEITQAYEVISDPQKRQTYDQFGAAAFDPSTGSGPFGQGGPFGGAGGGQAGRYGPFTYTYTNGGNADFDFGGFSDPFDIFEQFFGGGGSPFGNRQRRPVYSLTVSFMDAVKGAEKEVMIDNKKQKIKIPAGVERGSRIRFDKYDVVVDVTPDKRFHREGSDIVTEEEVSFAMAALGQEITVETVDGPVKIRIPAGTQPDTLIRLSGRGVQSIRNSSRGDHYIRVKIKIPKNLTTRQKQLLEEFDKENSVKKTWF